MVKVARGQYNAPESLARFIDFKIRGGQSGSSDVIEARKRLYDAQTHKTELEVSRIKRETVSAVDHLTDMRELQQIFNTALDDIDADLAADLAILSAPAEINDRLTLQSNAVRQSVADAIVAYAGTVEV